MSTPQHVLRTAIELAHANVECGGRPFGAVVVMDGEILTTGVNEVIGTHDPTAHAELMAIRAASQKLGSSNLAGLAEQSMKITYQPVRLESRVDLYEAWQSRA